MNRIPRVGAAAPAAKYTRNAYDPSLNYGPSNFDVRHMFKGDVVYQLPFGNGKKFLGSGGILDAILGGWQASTIFVLQSGKPFTPQVGTADNSGTLSGGIVSIRMVSKCHRQPECIKSKRSGIV